MINIESLTMENLRKSLKSPLRESTKMSIIAQARELFAQLN